MQRSWPAAATLLGCYTAADHIARGHYGKAVEAIVPKFIRDPLKAVREGTQGITTYSGEPLMETTLAEDVGRLLGFAPARASEKYEARNAVMNAEAAITERRSAIIGRAVRARLDSDADAYREALAEMRAWNERHPMARITLVHIQQSLRERLRRRAKAENGVVLPCSPARHRSPCWPRSWLWSCWRLPVAGSAGHRVHVRRPAAPDRSSRADGPRRRRAGVRGGAGCTRAGVRADRGRAHATATATDSPDVRPRGQPGARGLRRGVSQDSRQACRGRDLSETAPMPRRRPRRSASTG